MSRYPEGSWPSRPATNGRRNDSRGVQGAQSFTSERGEDLAALTDILAKREQEFHDYHRRTVQYLNDTLQEHNVLREKIRHLEAACAAEREAVAFRLLEAASASPKANVIQPLIRFEKHTSEVHSVDMCRNSTDAGSLIAATASWDQTVWVFPCKGDGAPKCLGPTLTSTDGSEVKIGGLYSVAFARTQPKILGCASADYNVYLCNWDTGKHIKTLSGHAGEVNSIDFHCTQQVACSASDDKKVIIWDFQEALTLRALDQHEREVYGACFLNKSKVKGAEFLVGTCSFDRKARLFDMRDKKVVATLAHHQDDILGIDYSASTGLLATGSDDGDVCLWDERKSWGLRNTIKTRRFETTHEDNEVKRVVFSPDGKYIAVGGSNCKVLVYDTAGQDSQPVAVLDGHSDCVFDVAWEEQLLVSASHDKTACVWQMEDIGK